MLNMYVFIIYFFKGQCFLLLGWWKLVYLVKVMELKSFNLDFFEFSDLMVVFYISISYQRRLMFKMKYSLVVVDYCDDNYQNKL